jgi:hypothetical protein
MFITLYALTLKENNIFEMEIIKVFWTFLGGRI